ncbi:LysM domain-protein [Staphylotrichum tortipilum]|uniref:LysM domain-protein n=1 Tax=Staphylotrichum tortipilum TaxID=2831512 RepID=A0AAN6MRZ6_9PEZI|nr:LysM domain-protein [Staphylotrichum longicolle]
MVSNCDAFLKVAKGDSCDSITANGISVDQLHAWNPAIGGTSCNGLWANAYVCVSIIGHTLTPTNAAGNGIATPTLIQDNMTRSCRAFYKAVSGDTHDSIARRAGITTA